MTRACERTATRRWTTSGLAGSGVALGILLGISCGGGAGADGTTGGVGGDLSSGSTSSGSGGASTSSSSASSSTGSTSSSSTGSSSSSSSGATGVTGVTGGTLDALSFVVVGDTRPPIPDDFAGYPTAVITQIWKDVAATSPQPAFAVGTGDYAYGVLTVDKQFDAYATARAAYAGVMFQAMGNHECSWLGLTTSNCGQGNADGVTATFTNFLTKSLTPLGLTEPYYAVEIASPSSAWTAKMVFIAANAWDATQAAWLDAELAKPTTYTFVVRHESVHANTAPGVTPSETILAKHPWTLKIVGHVHTYQYVPADREVMVGNGGAPLSGAANYGYVIATQRADGAIAFKSYEYMSNAVVDSFAVKADGTPAP